MWPLFAGAMMRSVEVAERSGDEPEHFVIQTQTFPFMDKPANYHD